MDILTGSTLPWISEASRHIGLAEVPGVSTNGTIAAWLRQLRAWWDDDETPWCGLFVGHCIDAVDLPVPKYWMRAKAWAEWGIRLSVPVPGCIVVFERTGGGHVGFLIGQDAQGRYMVLGGNQGNKVSVAPFARERAIAYVWPPGYEMPPLSRLAVLDSRGMAASTNEA